MSAPITVIFHTPDGSDQYHARLHHVPRVGETISLRDKHGALTTSGVVTHVDWSIMRNIDAGQPWVQYATVLLGKDG